MALVALAAVLAITGPNLVHLYDTTVATCAAHDDCSAASTALLSTQHTLYVTLNAVMVVVPAVIGVFWGAPLVASELESGTFRLAWTQSVTRTRWLAVKLGLVGLASMVVAGLLSLMVTWWSSPIDQVNLAPFLSFDERDIVPVAYAAFAFAFGATAGVVIRRTLPSMATTLAAYVAVRGAITYWIRPHFAVPVQLIVPDNVIAAGGPTTPAPAGLNPRDWVLSNQTINTAGRVIGQDGNLGTGVGVNIGVGPHGVTIGGVGSCPNLTLTKISGSLNQSVASRLVQRCVNQLHVRELLTYQPSHRYWSFQLYELAVFLGLAAILTGICFWWVRRRIL